MDEKQAFSTLETLHNCVLYVGIADAYARNNLTSNDTHLADSFAIQKGKNSSSVSMTVNSTLTKCFDQYCGTSSVCTELLGDSRWQASLNDSGSIPYYYEYTPRYTVYDFSEQGDYLCEFIAHSYPLNSDIGGIGVYVSYWIQSSLALLGAFLVLLWGWGPHYIYFPSIAGRRGEKGSKLTKGISISFGNRRLAHLTAALADFQKAQCFFMLAVNVGALANKANGGLVPVSLQQLYDNYLLLASVAISGYLPVTATLLALHMVDMTSAYLLALSGCTVALSVATAAAVDIFSPSQGDLSSIQAQAAKGSYSACSSMDLTVYCLQYQYDDVNNTYIWGIMAYCVVVLSYIVAYHLNVFRDPLNNQTRPWVSRFASWMSSIRFLQFALTIPVLLVIGFGSFTWVLGILTLAYLVSPLVFRLRCARRIKIKDAMSLACGPDLLAWVFWLVAFCSYPSPLSFLIWISFTISSFQLLRKAYVEDTTIRKWGLKYRQFANEDETLAAPSLGEGSERIHMRTSFRITIKASITLVTLTSMGIEKLEQKAASHDWPRKYRRFLVIFFYWVLFAGCIVCFVLDFLGLASFQAKIDHKSWTFGQIVAISVWTPPLCEFFHLELRGMKRGFQHRLLPPYRISTMDKSTERIDLEREACEMDEEHDSDVMMGNVMQENDIISSELGQADSGRVSKRDIG